LPHLCDRCRDRPGEFLPAMIRLEWNGIPAAFDECVISLCKSIRYPHDAVFDHRALLVAGIVDRRQLFGCEFAGFFQDRVDQIRCDLIAAWKLHDLIQKAHILERELHVSDRGGVRDHRNLFLRYRSYFSTKRAVSTCPDS